MFEDEPPEEADVPDEPEGAAVVAEEFDPAATDEDFFELLHPTIATVVSTATTTAIVRRM